jgi:uncharacterized protein
MERVSVCKERQSIAVGGETTTAMVECVPNERALFVFAHGAGGHMADRGMEQLATLLHERGISTVRFNFLYREKGSRKPDPTLRLEACLSAVVEHARKTLEPRTLLIGGRSMGGRIGSMLAAKGLRCEGLLLFAYPLHPAGKPDKLRDAHLGEISAPVLCFNGTRDALCTRELMDKVVSSLGANWTLHWLDGADHSFHVLKSSGRSDADVMKEVDSAVATWLEQTIRARS